MSSPKIQERFHFEDKFDELISKFSIAYSLERPSNLIDFAVEYFTKLQHKQREQYDTKRNEDEISSPSAISSIVDEEPTITTKCLERRYAFFTPGYDPEKDPDDDEGTMAMTQITGQQKARLTEAVRNILLFRPLDADQMNQVLNAMFEKKVKAKEIIIRQGNNNAYFYVIESGIYKAYVDGNLTDTFVGEGYFGETALIDDELRDETIQAETDGRLWGIARQTFLRIKTKSTFKKRKMYVTLLESVRLFKDLQPKELENLADALISKVHKKDDKIIGQGDKTDGIYFIEEGEVSIVRMNESGKFSELKKLSKGQYFGESEIVTREKRNESAYAISDEVKLAFLDVETCQRFLRKFKNIPKPEKKFNLLKKLFFK